MTEAEDRFTDALVDVPRSDRKWLVRLSEEDLERAADVAEAAAAITVAAYPRRPEQPRPTARGGTVPRPGPLYQERPMLAGLGGWRVVEEED
jgi:hypothetical protein